MHHESVPSMRLATLAATPSSFRSASCPRGPQCTRVRTLRRSTLGRGGRAESSTDHVSAAGRGQNLTRMRKKKSRKKKHHAHSNLSTPAAYTNAMAAAAWVDAARLLPGVDVDRCVCARASPEAVPPPPLRFRCASPSPPAPSVPTRSELAVAREREMRSGRLPLARIDEPGYVARKCELLRARLERGGVSWVRERVRVRGAGVLLARALWLGTHTVNGALLSRPHQGLRGPAQRVWGWDEWVGVGGVGGAAEAKDRDEAHAIPTDTVRFSNALGAEDQSVHMQDAGRSLRPGACDGSAASRRVLSGSPVATCACSMCTSSMHACARAYWHVVHWQSARIAWRAQA